MDRNLPLALSQIVDKAILRECQEAVLAAALVENPYSDHKLTVGTARDGMPPTFYRLNLRQAALSAATYMPTLFGLTTPTQAAVNLGCTVLAVLLSVTNNSSRLSLEEGALFFLVYSAPQRRLTIKAARNKFLALCRKYQGMKPTAFDETKDSLCARGCLIPEEGALRLNDLVVLRKLPRQA